MCCDTLWLPKFSGIVDAARQVPIHSVRRPVDAGDVSLDSSLMHISGAHLLEAVSIKGPFLTH